MHYWNGKGLFSMMVFARFQLIMFASGAVHNKPGNNNQSSDNCPVNLRF